MNSIADSSVIIQTSCESVPSTSSWFGEVALIVGHLRKQGILTQICEGVRFARGRFGHYEVIDFLAVLFGYAISGERTLETFYERLQPLAEQHHEEATPGQCAFASIGYRKCAASLEGLESATASASMYTTAQPMSRDPDGTDSFCQTG